MIYGIEYCKDANNFQINTLKYITEHNLKDVINQNGRGWSLIGVAEDANKAAEFVEALIKRFPDLGKGIDYAKLNSKSPPEQDAAP